MKRAFTLIELLVVMVIIAVMATTVVAVVRHFGGKSPASRANYIPPSE